MGWGPIPLERLESHPTSRVLRSNNRRLDWNTIHSGEIESVQCEFCSLNPCTGRKCDCTSKCSQESNCIHSFRVHFVTGISICHHGILHTDLVRSLLHIFTTLSLSLTIEVLRFQSLQGDTAATSGYKQLALVVSVSLSTLFSGGLTVKIGYYSPFLIGGAVFTSIGAGLLYSIDYDSSLGMLIGYQIVFGVGVGMGLNAATVAVQTVLPDETVAKGISAELTIRLLGTALGTPIAQSVLQQSLVSKLSRQVAVLVFNSEGSATDAKGILTGIYGAGTPGLRSALEAFNYACTRTFMVALIMSCLCFPLSLLAEWKSTKTEKRDVEDRREGRGVEKIGDEEASD